MRNLWVYDSGAWVKPASVFGARDGGWYLVDTMSIVCDGEYKIVLDQQMVTAEVVISLFSAIPGNTDDNSVYWTTLIGGRMLGDINNDGTINVLDGLYLNYYRARLFGSIPAGGRDWIEQQIIPYMTDNSPPI